MPATRESGSSRTCIFCERRPLTREHVFGDWIRRLAAIEETAPAYHSFHQPANPPRVIEFAAPPLAQTARVVCAQCNNGWMAQLEHSVSGVLGPLLQGFERTVDQNALAVLARWAFKTTFIIDAASSNRGHGFPQEHRDLLRQRLMPPPLSAVWVTTWPGTTTAWTQHWGMSMRAREKPETDQITAYGATIAIGPMVFRTFATSEPELDPAAIQDRLEGITRIWPAKAALEFKPIFSLTAEELEAFAFGVPRALERTFGGAEGQSFWLGEGESGPIRGPV